MCQERTLTLTGNTSIGGSSSWSMSWVGSLNEWTTGTITVGGITGTFYLKNYDPTSFQAIMGFTGYNADAGFEQEIFNDSSCDPLHAHYVTQPTNPGHSATGYLNFNGITDVYIDDTEPAVPTACDIVVLVLGCNGLPVEGATVHLQISGSTVDTQTTDSTGKAFFSDSFLTSTGLYTTVTSKSRFTSDTSNWNAFSDGLGVSVTLSPTSSYRRTDDCADPVATTLHATHPLFGAITLTYNASGSHGQGWYASVSYSYSACQCCSATTVTVTCFLSTGLAYTEYWKST